MRSPKCKNECATITPSGKIVEKLHTRLGVAAVLGVWAAGADSSGAIWCAWRHALTVGCIAVMVFAIGQRELPAFCGMKILR
jgi:hypothetical protein